MKLAGSSVTLGNGTSGVATCRKVQRTFHSVLRLIMSSLSSGTKLFTSSTHSRYEPLVEPCLINFHINDGVKK